MVRLLLLFLFFSNYVIAEDSYYKELFIEEDYFRLVSELKKDEYESRGTPSGLKSSVRLIKVYAFTKNFEDADLWLKKTKDLYGGSFVDHSRLRIELNFLLERNLDSFAPQGDSLDERKMHYIASFLNKGEDYLDEKDRESYEKEVRGELKNPFLAAALNVIPGLGQWYVGGWKSALSPFIVNTFLISVSVLAFSEGENVLGWASSGVAASYYLSNFYTGYLMANRFNMATKSSFKNKLISSKNIQLRIFNFDF